MNFCPNCGKNISEDSKFCSKCGAKLQETENVNATDSTFESPKPNIGNKKIFFGIGIGILVVIIIFMISYTGKHKGPEKAVYNYMESIYKGDWDLLLESVSPMLKQMILMEYEDYTEEEIEEEMQDASDELMDILGSDWIKELKIETVKVDKDTAIVRVFFSEDYENYIDMKLLKEKGKWSVINAPDWW